MFYISNNNMYVPQLLDFALLGFELDGSWQSWDSRTRQYHVYIYIYIYIIYIHIYVYVSCSAVP